MSEDVKYGPYEPRYKFCEIYTNLYHQINAVTRNFVESKSIPRSSLTKKAIDRSRILHCLRADGDMCCHRSAFMSGPLSWIEQEQDEIRKFAIRERAKVFDILQNNPYLVPRKQGEPHEIRFRNNATSFSLNPIIWAQSLRSIDHCRKARRYAQALEKYQGTVYNILCEAERRVQHVLEVCQERGISVSPYKE